MKKILPFLNNCLQSINKATLLVLFVLYSTISFGQTIATAKTYTANVVDCSKIDVKIDITGANPAKRNADVILVIDVSGSMANTISGDLKTSMDYAKAAAKAFITTAAASNPANRIGIVSYTTNAKLEIGLTTLNASGITSLNAKIDALAATNSTNIQDGIVKAETELETNGQFDCDTARSIVLLTDGVANRTGPVGSTTSCGTVSTSNTCVTSAIAAANNARTTTKSSIVYNNQIFAVGLLGGVSGNIATVGDDRYVAKFTLDGIQGSPASITFTGADLTGIYNTIATQINWVAQNLIEKETVASGFTISNLTTTKGTTTQSGQVITWNNPFLNAETITLKYTLTPDGTVCGNQTLGSSSYDYGNSVCVNVTNTPINTPSYFVACKPTITGILTGCGSTTLTANSNAASPTYTWYKDNVIIPLATSSTLVATASGSYTVKVKNGTTNCELTSAASTVTITPSPLLVAPGNATIEGCGTSAITGLPYSTTDATITLAQLTTVGGSLSNSASIGSFTISYKDTSSGTCPTIVTRTYKVTAGCGNVTATQTISIKDTTKPTASNPAAITLTGCNGTFPAANVSVVTDEADACSTPTVTFVSDSTPSIVGCTETTVRTYKVTDACGNSINVTQNLIRTVDTTKPTASNPAAITLTGCNGTFPAADVSVVTDEADACSTPTVTFVSDSAPSIVGCTETTVRTYKVTDACGNFINVTQNLIRTVDTTNPTASNPAAITLTGCNGTFPAANVSVVTDEADACSTPTVTFVSDSTPSIVGCTETTVRTYKVTDACGNFINVTQNLIRTVDTTKPTASNPAAITLTGCNGTFPAANVSVVTDEADACSTPTVTL